MAEVIFLFNSIGYVFSLAEKETDLTKRKALGRGYGLDEEEDEENIEIKGSPEDAEKNKQALALRSSIQINKEEERKKLLSRDPKAKQIASEVGMSAATNAIIAGKSDEEALEIAQQAIDKALSEYKPSVSIAKGTEIAAKIIETWEEKENEKNHIFTCEFEINDYPTNARGKAIKRDFTKSIGDMFEVDIMPKGVFVEPGKRPPNGQKKLHLYIRGSNKMNVQNAFIEIKRNLDETALMYYTMGSHAGGYGGNVGKYTV
jgi:ATP-dependent RNA helicase DDX46/PRP5